MCPPVGLNNPCQWNYKFTMEDEDMDTDEIEMRIIKPFDVFPHMTIEARIIFEYEDDCYDKLIINATYKNHGEGWGLKDSQVISYPSDKRFSSADFLYTPLYNKTITAPQDLVPHKAKIHLAIATVNPCSLEDLYKALVKSYDDEQWDNSLVEYLVNYTELSDTEKVQTIAIMESEFGINGYGVLEKHPSILKNGLNSYEIKRRIHFFI